MKISKKLLDHQHNPLSWLYSLLFFILFCFGFWHHDWLIIIITIIGLGTTWFYFPESTVKYDWAEKCIAAGVEWVQKPFDTEKAIVSAVYTVFFLLLLISLWAHIGSLVTISIVLLVVTKLYTFRSLWLGFFSSKHKKVTEKSATSQAQEASDSEKTESKENKES